MSYPEAPDPNLGIAKKHHYAALKKQGGRAINEPIRTAKHPRVKIRKVKVFVTAKDSRTESIVGYSYIMVAENIPKILIDNAMIRQNIQNKSLAEREYTVFVLGKSQDEIIEEILRLIRQSEFGENSGFDIQWGQGWRRSYGYIYQEGKDEGKYYAEGYGHSGYATTGWHDQQATIYTEEEMKTHIAKNFRKFKKVLDAIQAEEGR